tara:strand:- start:1 stop:126 length:126 start_codon:yes stop_codon:yes gene_type:complete
MKNDREIRRLRKLIFNLQLRGNHRAANRLIKKMEELRNGNK